MNNKIKIIAATTLLALPFSFALAKNGNGTPNMEIRDKAPMMKELNKNTEGRFSSTTMATSTRMMGEKKEDRKEEQKDEHREKLMATAKDRLQKMFERFEATLAREASIVTKIISRIEKVKSAGGNTTEAEKYITEAKKHFDEAGVALTALKNASSSPEALVNSSVSTSTVSMSAFKKVKEMTQSIEMHIREGHEALNRAVGLLKGPSNDKATTTSKHSN